MFMTNGRREIIKKLSLIFLLFILIITFCSGCQSYSASTAYRLAENFEDYKGIFEEYDVEAKVITYEEQEYIQLIFPDGVNAIYGTKLEYIEYDLEKEENGYIRSAKLEIKIKDNESALVYLHYEGHEDGKGSGTTNGTFVLPDFSEMLPSRALKQDDGSALLLIESWTTEQEMADLYKEAKDMEQLMFEHDSKKEDTE